MAGETASKILNLVGHWVGPFQLQRLLGKGAMGAVYLAQDPVLRRGVALKLIPKSSDTADEEQHERFLREARAAARLVHANVVQIYQVGETLDFRFIAMEYVEGTSMSQAARQQGGRLSEQFGMERMREVTDALSLAETYGICHRDIKPSNLLLTTGGVLKVADFGLASQTGGDTIGASSPAQLEGTPFYMSPEQWSGSPITPAADIYSLGCTFFHLLVGTTPYPARDMFGSLQAHCWGPVPDPRAHLPSMDPRLAELLENCMSKRPEDRPRAKTLALTLEEMLLLRRSQVRPRNAAVLHHGEAPTVEQPVTGPFAARSLPRSAPPAAQGLTPSPPSVEQRRALGTEPPSALTGTTRQPAERSYRQYYGLREHPFSDIRRPLHYWDGGPHAAALRSMGAAVASGRPVILMGAAGSGRTFTSEMLQQKYPRLHVYAVEPQLLLGSSILVSLCRQVGVMIHESSSHRFVLEAFISHVVPPSAPDTIVTFVIDGFDPADTQILEDVLLLRRHTSRGRVGLVLVGDPSLGAQLAAHPNGAALFADAESMHLTPLTQAEMLDYIRFRMSVAGGNRHLELDAASQQLLFARTAGNPKLINVYCHNMLTLVALLGEDQARFKTVRLAMKTSSYLTSGTALALLQGEAKEGGR